jgi:CRP/FNR family cyclic AMP-dependent transcriptional regulator
LLGRGNACVTLEERRRHTPKLRNVIVFRYLTDEALADMPATCAIELYDDGERIASGRDLDTDLFAVLEGSVNVFVGERDRPDKELFICALGEGDVFGEAGLFLQTPRTANVVSGGESAILRIGRDDLFAFIQKHPSGGIKILYIIIYSLLKKLREANQELTFERKSVLPQGDIDSIVEEAMRKM